MFDDHHPESKEDDILKQYWIKRFQRGSALNRNQTTLMAMLNSLGKRLRRLVCEGYTATAMTKMS